MILTNLIKISEKNIIRIGPLFLSIIISIQESAPTNNTYACPDLQKNVHNSGEILGRDSNETDSIDSAFNFLKICLERNIACQEQHFNLLDQYVAFETTEESRKFFEDYVKLCSSKLFNKN